jgi:hypothetical protein
VIAVGAGSGGGPQVKVFDASTLAVKADFLAFDGAFTGGVSVAMGQWNGHDVIVVGAGPGGGSEVKIFDAETLQLLADFSAFSAGFLDGVHVAVGADGIVAGAGAGLQTLFFPTRRSSRAVFLLRTRPCRSRRPPVWWSSL